MNVQSFDGKLGLDVRSDNGPVQMEIADGGIGYLAHIPKSGIIDVFLTATERRLKVLLSHQKPSGTIEQMPEAFIPRGETRRLQVALLPTIDGNGAVRIQYYVMTTHGRILSFAELGFAYQIDPELTK